MQRNVVVEVGVDQLDLPVADNALVVFTPSGLRGRFDKGLSVRQAALSLGVDLDSTCGGHGLCGRCQVRVVDGEFPKHNITSSMEHLSCFSDAEKEYKNRRGLASDRRLACYAKIEGDLLVDIPDESQLHKHVIYKQTSAHSIELDSIIHTYYLEVPESSMSSSDGVTNLTMAIEQQWGIDNISLVSVSEQDIRSCLQEAGGNVTTVIRSGQEVVDVRPGFHEQVYGLAIDLGTTSLAVYLLDLASGEVVAQAGDMNPQIRYGEDIMSRVSHVMQKPEDAPLLTSLVRDSLNRLISLQAEQLNINMSDIYEVVIVGNSVMHHLLLGLDPVPLGLAPFTLVNGDAQTKKASELDLACLPNAFVYTLPCLAGHVGADTAALILAESPHQSDDMSLIIDIGTNAEIVLGNRKQLYVTSSPTGPAFEGAQISCGQRAVAGAIERVRIDRETLEPRFKVIGCDLWSNEQGFYEATAKSGVTGICGSGIIEVVAEMVLAGIVTPAGVISNSGQDKSARIVADGRVYSYLIHDEQQRRIHITQHDIRAIQLAKAALFACTRLLMDRCGIEKPDSIRLAGAFGSLIDPKYATVLGLIPGCEPERIQAIGNAAGTGACKALLNKKARREIEELVPDIERIETAGETLFQQYFVEAMALPKNSGQLEEMRN
jgi:uncharacterized 2Fe-2S/4Fe-4S cluster protein (DUF4445 family)